MKPKLNVIQRILLGLGIVGGVCIVSLIGLRLLGLLRDFATPSDAMAPALSPGDKVWMEGFTFISRKPARGDIVAFKASGLQFLQERQIYVKRIVGLPRETVRIADGKLFINETEVTIRNKAGPIRYLNAPGSQYLSFGDQRITVPQDEFFVLGDNTTNSLDSRYFGFLPRDQVRGRICFCYSPPRNFGPVR